MWLENKALYGPIKPFDRIDLPPLTLIIGLNGAGKSQLLRGIAAGHILSEVTQNIEDAKPNGDIVLVTNHDPEPIGLTKETNTDLSAMFSRAVRPRIDSELIEEFVKEQFTELALVEAGLLSATGKTLAELGQEWIAFARTGTFTATTLQNVPNVFEFVQQPATRLLSLATLLRKARLGDAVSAETMPLTFAEPLLWSRADIGARIGWPEGTLFTPELVETFLEYRNRRWRNQMQRQSDLDDGTSEAIDAAEFERLYGRPPWEDVTAALKKFGLPYTVAKIASSVEKPVRFELMRDDGTVPLGYADLSSGERVLLRMVLATFQVDDNRLNVHPAKLVLLDELDASLHPDNVRRWLEAVQDNYVETLGISCIMTTHSPTTVALAPEGSIFEMTADDPRPMPISKQQAIDRLTAGLPMLAINYSARRQVFTESTIDVDHYSRLHDLMRPHLEMDRTLSFVGTSTKGSCTFVYDMVGHMHTNGNEAVFGIVDWDLKNKPTQRVKVLADGSHYSKDNVLLDPLLVGALLLKDNNLAIQPGVDYADLRGALPELLQQVSDAVIAKVKFPPAANLAMATNHYWGGFALDVREAYQTWNGHDWETALKLAFPMLGGRYRAEGELIDAIIRRVISGNLALCPKPVTNLLVSLANDKP